MLYCMAGAKAPLCKGKAFASRSVCYAKQQDTSKNSFYAGVAALLPQLSFAKK